MMYNFIDTNEQPGTLPLPAEAMSFGGVYIENEINGYRTLYVEGREKISASIDFTEVQTRDGALYRGMRYEPRTLVIGFQLNSASAAAQMAAYNELLHILSQKQAQIIFADEPDKFYIGTKTKITNTPPGRLAVTGEIEIFCADPFKYSVQEYEVTDTGGTITVDYGGTYPAHPKFTAVSEDHDCGFYQFSTRGYTIQVGDPDETDTEEQAPEDLAETVVSYRFGSNNETANYNNDNNYWKRSEKITPFNQYQQTSKIVQRGYYIFPYVPDNTSPYTYLYGPALGHTFTEAEGTHRNFVFDFVHMFNPRDNQGLVGGFDFYINDVDGQPICGLSIFHDVGSTIKWSMLGPAGAVKTGTFTLTNNPFTTWTTEVIKKIESTLTFSLGGEDFSVEIPGIEAKLASNMTFVFYFKPGQNWLTENNALNWVTFRSVPSAWEEIANKIPTGGLVEVNTGSGDIMLNGSLAADLGMVDNDFERFTLEYGENTVTCTSSDWVTDAEYAMKYREVYL